MTRKPSSEPLVNIVCTVLFCAYVFLYLLFFQNNMLAYAQYYLSEGATTYNSLIGAVIITSTLLLVSGLTARTIAKNLSVAPALYHLPSLLILASICDINIVEGKQTDVFGYSWVFAILICLLLALANYFAGKAKLRSRDVFSNLLLNLLIIVTMFLGSAFMSNTDEIDHVRLRAEHQIMSGDYEKVEKLYFKRNINTSELTMLKALALAKSGRMGDAFFEQRLVRGSDNLFPSADNKLLMLPSIEIYKTVGGVPAKGMKARRCLEKLEESGKITPAGRDYLYIACLLDRDIDAFAGYFKKHNDSIEVVPKHYAEALAIYDYERGNTPADSLKTDMELAFDGFFAMQKEYPEEALRENALRDKYGKTYWFYYFFTASSAFTQSVSKEN